MDMLLEKMINTFTTSSHEESMRNKIIDEIDILGLTYEIDKMDNLIVKLGTKSKNDKDIMLVSHMDSVSLIVTFIDDNGYARVGTVGEFNFEDWIGNLVEFANGTIARVCASKKEPKIADIYLDLFSNSKEETIKKIQEGDVAILKKDVVKIEDKVIGSTLDSKISSYILLNTLMEITKDKEKIENLDHEISFVFSTEKQLDGRGARAAAYKLDPSYCIVIDVEEANDTLGGDNKVKLNKGVGIHVLDRDLIVHHEVKEMLEKSCKDLKIDNQYIFNEKGTNGGRIHKERCGIKTGALSIPMRYKNTLNEVVKIKDIEDAIKVLLKVVE